MKYGHKFTSTTEYEAFAMSDGVKIGPNVSLIREGDNKILHYHDLDKTRTLYYRTDDHKKALPESINEADVLLNDYSTAADFGKFIYKNELTLTQVNEFRTIPQVSEVIHFLEEEPSL